jgi:hypothetical protein
MAIRYVKDFEFPSAAGFSSSTPSKVTGPMFAKGGKVEKEPKGMMVIIGVGKPKGEAPMEHKKGGKVAKVMGEFGEGKLHSGSKKGPKVTNPKQAVAIALSEQREAKKSRGGIEYIDKGKDTSVPVSIKGTKGQSTDEDFYGKAKDMPMPTRRPATMKKGGYAEGGMKAEQGVALPDMSPEKEMFEVYDRQSGDVVGTYGSLKQASRAVDRRDNEYGGYRYGHRPVAKAKGGAVHDDAAQDKAMIKSMVKPDALKKAMGGPAVQMAKSNAIESSLKGQKKTAYADGGAAARPFGSGARQTAPSVGSTQYKADGGMALAAPRIASPLQQMGPRPSGVPVAPRAPMIPQQAAPAGGPRIGVGRSRSGKPDVGAIRAAMARAASQAVPENAPGMMKKGGKVKC